MKFTKFSIYTIINYLIVAILFIHAVAVFKNTLVYLGACLVLVCVWVWIWLDRREKNTDNQINKGELKGGNENDTEYNEKTI